MIPKHLQLYDETYFARGKEAGVSGYENYADCQPLLFEWGRLLDKTFEPSSLLDIGAAYGYLPEFFTRFGIEAVGVEPSDFARSQSRVPLLAGSLPWLPIPADKRFDLVTCTEVLEHVPEELVAESLASLTRVTGRVLVLLIMLEGPAAHDDEGHINLHDRLWWEERLDLTGLVRNKETESLLNGHAMAKSLGWTGRMFVRERR